MLLFRYFFISNSTKASTFNPIRYGSYTNKLWWRSQRTQRDFAIYAVTKQTSRSKRGRIARYIRLEIMILALCLKLLLGNHNSVYISPFVFSLSWRKVFFTVCLSWFNYLTKALESDDACVNRCWSLDNDTCTILVEDCWIEQNFTL